MTSHTMHRVISGLMLGVALLVGVLFTGQHPARVQAQSPTPLATLQPVSLSANLCEQQCLRETITIQLPPREEPVINQMDVVFLLDISGSMDDVLNTVTNESSNIADGLRTLISDTRFAVGVFSDYDDVPWGLPVNFTTNLTQLNQGLRGIDIEYGGDTRESYTRAFWELSQLEWRDGAVKIIVIFTDAPPHREDRGRDEQFGTSDDLEYEVVLDTLHSMGVRVIGVDSGSAGSELSEAGTATDGAYFVLSSVSDIPNRVISSISEELAEIRLAFRVMDAEQAGWFTQDPGSFNYPDDGQPMQVILEFCPAEQNLSRGTYIFDFALMESSTTYANLPATVNYSPVCNALLIPDTVTDTGDDCTEAPFWQSPGIIIRNSPDNGTSSQPVRAGYPHVVYVSVKNNGFEDIRDVSVTLREADSLLSDSFTVIGQQVTDIPFGQTVMVGPFEWTPTTTTVALSAIAESPEVSLSDETYPCASQHAQRREISLPLDNFTLNSPMPTGLLTIADLHAEGDLSVDTNGLSSGEFAGWVSSDNEERAESGQPLTIQTGDNARQLIFSTDTIKRLGLSVITGREVIQGADILVEPAQRLVNTDETTTLTEYNQTFTPPTELLIPIIILLIVSIVIALIRTRTPE